MTDEECEARASTPLGSSRSYPEELAWPDPYATLALFTEFDDFDHYVFLYCDGSSWSSPDGTHILRQSMERVMRATPYESVVLTGCSAGGLAVIYACEWVREAYPDTPIMCMHDGSLFFGDMSAMLHYHNGTTPRGRTDAVDVLLDGLPILTITDKWDWDWTTSASCKRDPSQCTALELHTRRKRSDIIASLPYRVWATNESHHCRLGGSVPPTLTTHLRSVL